MSELLRPALITHIGSLSEANPTTVELPPSGLLRSRRFQSSAVLEDCRAGRHRMVIGEQGDAVGRIQQALVDLGYPLPRYGVDARYGLETADVVARFKREHNITPSDGVVGPQTMAALDALFSGEGPHPFMPPPVVVAPPSPFARWEPLISFRPPVAVQTAVKGRGPYWAGFKPEFSHHIEDANGKINLDEYMVRVTRLPTLLGHVLTPSELLEYIRANFNAFVNSNKAQFYPYDLSIDAPVWRSAAPLGAVIHIDIKEPWTSLYINADNGSVVCSEQDSGHWIFSTIFTPRDFNHPVSGNRMWGFKEVDGAWLFFTRGADRITLASDQIAFESKIFQGGDDLWRSFQNKLNQFVNDPSQGGAATILPPISNRFDWPTIKAAHFKPTVPYISGF